MGGRGNDPDRILHLGHHLEVRRWPCYLPDLCCEDEDRAGGGFGREQDGRVGVQPFHLLCTVFYDQAAIAMSSTSVPFHCNIFCMFFLSTCCLSAYDLSIYSVSSNVQTDAVCTYAQVGVSISAPWILLHIRVNACITSRLLFSL